MLSDEAPAQALAGGLFAARISRSGVAQLTRKIYVII
jgi:hypothetical protein